MNDPHKPVMRFPRIRVIQGYLETFSTAAFFIYSWSILVILWELPSFLLRFNLVDVLGYVAYLFMYALIECLAVTVFLIILSMVLPARLLKANLPTTGGLLVVTLIISAVFSRALPEIWRWIPTVIPLNTISAMLLISGIWLFLTLLLPVYAILLGKNDIIKRFMTSFTDRIYPLVVLYFTFSIFGIFIVILRNTR